MPAKVEVPVLFNDCEEPVIVTDRATISKISILIKAVVSQNSKWQKRGCIVTTPVKIPFSKAAGELLLSNVVDYDKKYSQRGILTLDAYQAAVDARLESLKELMDLALFLGCTSFHEVIGFVCARRMDEFSPEEAAYFLGLELDGPEDEWTLHPLLGNGI